jgi:site-specific DNA-methyltransferase (adenine-specific)
VLDCIANLSNDEVFTPPNIVNEMLDLLPQELFSNSSTTFLDPACKSGVFLREIAKRLIDGLKDEFPDLQVRLDHIFQKQLFGIAITELTSLLSRRSVYCSKFPSSKYSISIFDDAQGNIRFKRVEHYWSRGKCSYCGASKAEYDRDSELETHAYEFIHTETPEELFNMKFDVIIGNPPYQFGVGNEGGNSSKARAIYHLFISNAIRLQPRFVCMITPSRWMTRSVEGISAQWLDDMIGDKRIREMRDYLDAGDIFTGTPPKGGVSFFLWDRDYQGQCIYTLYRFAGDANPTKRFDYLDPRKAGIVIRDNKAFPILDKVEVIEGSYFANDHNNFSSFVSPKDFFTSKDMLTSSWRGYRGSKDANHTIKYYLNRNIHERDFGWISIAQIPKNRQSISFHKVYIPAAGGSGTDEQILGYPFYGEPNSVCSQTYLAIGHNHNLSSEECHNIMSYISTRFFRFLVSLKKKTQNGPRAVYSFVPIQDFFEPWTDEKLYTKYSLNKEEISYIESMIRPMSLDGESND